MKKELTCIALLLALCAALRAQEREPKSVFEVGRPITCCGDNFRNLLDNWRPGTIDNTHEIKILRYERAAVLSDSLTLSIYTDSVAMLDYPWAMQRFSSHGSSDGYEEEHYAIRLTNREEILERDSTLSPDEKELLRISLLQEGYLEKRRLQHVTLPPGAIVYRLLLEQDGKIYREFVFLDPKTFRVVEDSIFQYIPINFFTQTKK